MFSRLASFAILTLPLLAVATPAVVRNDAPSSGATTACCTSTEPANSAGGAAILKSIGVVISDPSVILGLGCSPISVVGVGSGSECSSTPVSCSSGVFGSIGVGCVPINA